MSRSKDKRQFSFFDEPIDQDPREAYLELGKHFYLTPQSIYLSWDEKKQLEFCRNRDLDSAKDPWNEKEDTEFFIERAKMYEEMMEKL